VEELVGLARLYEENVSVKQIKMKLGKPQMQITRGLVLRSLVEYYAFPHGYNI
jgi:hypothetical protein